jgi:hypothetical protein
LQVCKILSKEKSITAEIRGIENSSRKTQTVITGVKSSRFSVILDCD